MTEATMDDSLFDESVYVILKLISDELDPQEITKRIGFAPTKAGVKGSCIPGRKMPIKEGLWSYQYILTEYPWNIGQAIEELLPRLESKPELLDYCRAEDIYVEFSIVMYLNNRTPIFTLTPDLMARLCRINAVIDVDMYI
ncbi:MAG: DUF4279 domain-containing protein [Victivallaceae bacterium]